LRIGRGRWLELRWLERVSERVSPKAGVLPSQSRVVYGTSSLLLLPFLFKDGLESFLVWTIIRTMIVVLLMEDAIPFSFLMMASAPAATSASAAAPLTLMWWTRRARDQALGVSLWIGILLGVFAVKAKNVPRIGV
jgi:uncharacterized membrane protein